LALRNHVWGNALLINELVAQKRTDARRGDTLCDEGWTAPRTELLKKLWADGLSGDQIAGRLGGTTRCAVLGKVHRLGLSGRASTRTRREPSKYDRTGRTWKRKLSAEQKRQFKPPKAVLTLKQQSLTQALFPTEPLPKARETDIGRKTLEQLEDNDCRWPCSEHSPQMFCGEPKMPGLSYCLNHARRAFQPLYKGQNVHNSVGRGSLLRDVMGVPTRTMPVQVGEGISELAQRDDLNNPIPIKEAV
jgi:GcrA cell cycle regulator